MKKIIIHLIITIISLLGSTSSQAAFDELQITADSPFAIGTVFVDNGNAIFDFATQPLTATPFSISDGGVSALFSDSANDMQTASSTGFSFPGDVLIVNFANNDVLDILFNTTLHQVSFNFALEFGGNLSVTELLNSTVINTSTASSSIPNGYDFPEGHFVYPNIPEPATFALLSLGLAAMASFRRKSV
jgi:hypothetical protein